jgi:hypothetical protein
MSTPLETAIARVMEIDATIAALETERKPLIKIIEAAGEHGPHVPLEENDREGKQTILKTSKHILRVRLESDILVSSFEIGSPRDQQIKSILSPEEFDALFKVVKNHERKETDGHKFRLKAKKAVGDHAVFLKLIRALRSLDKDGIAKSKTVIAWDTCQQLPQP